MESKAGKSTEGLEAARGKKGEGSTAKFMLGFLQRMGMMSFNTCEEEQITANKRTSLVKSSGFLEKQVLNPVELYRNPVNIGFWLYIKNRE